MTKIAIIGSGFAGLSAAAFLAKSGHEVHVFEKNEQLGGRARAFKTQGFTFDMGPSWYWMPEVFENFFNKFNKSTKDYYELVRLDPSYKVVFGKGDEIDLPANYEELKSLFERLETGAAANLDSFLKEAEYKYRVGMEEFVWKPGSSILEFADFRVVSSLFKLDMFSSISNQINKLFSSPKIRKILEFPVLFLGATPQDTPALYSLMNYADIKLGTWYPLGGMSKIVDGMVDVAKSQGVTFHVASPVTQINVNAKKKVKSLTINGQEEFEFDIIVSGADYHHTDSQLLSDSFSNYSHKYWDSRVMAPSSLLFYVGTNKTYDNLAHHNLFFDRDFALHAQEIYTDPKWPTEPLFYICCPSKTDSSIAPQGSENLFFLIPIAPDLSDDEATRNFYFDIIAQRLLDLKGIDIKNDLVYIKSFCLNDFKSEYNSFKGNAYGLANTLMQTAFLKPKLKSKKVKNLYYTGQLTSPGPGVPPSIISGQVVADLINKSNI